jgi:nicotinate phosphoribosyltransferase
MNVSADAPFLDCAYKMAEYAGRPRRKRSEGKANWPGRKQVFRSFDGTGRMCGDLLGLDSDEAPGTRLLLPVLRAGKRVEPPPSLDSLRDRAREQMAMLPEALRGLPPATPYPVAVSPSLRALADEVDARTFARG